ncbi:non-histone chromosomal protein 6 [Chlamydoabsidia padenii]|nr:non-histone chromosomal protein 6 [Chlamydoabsidia padenii]
MPKETRASKTSSGRSRTGVKNPDAPKRGLSAYMFFSQEQREKVKTDNPEASFGQIGKLLGAKWKALSDAEKKPYQDKADEDKKRYEDEKAKLNK